MATRTRSGSRRSTSRREKETTRAEELVREEAEDLVHETMDAIRRIREAELPLEAGPFGAVEASPADIVDELDRGGPAFGGFLRAVGLGAADAQEKLDKTLATTAEALSKTNIKVVAVFEQQLKDDDGTMDKGVPHLQDLPLINYLMPTAYQWSRVFLQADMNVSEFNAANGFNIQGRSQSFSAGARVGYGFLGWSGGASASYAQSSYQVSGEASYSQDAAAGSMHLEATLEPRPDVALPRPFVLQKGPKIKLTRGPVSETSTTANNVTTVTRKVDVTAHLSKGDGSNHSAKPLDIDVSDPAITYTTTPTNGQTDTNGDLKIQLSRSGSPEELANRINALVRVSFGLVSDTVAVIL
jgi:hypothetical protein